MMGLSRMIAFSVDDTHVLHPGDLGRLPTDDECEHLGSVDCLMLPMGGTFTIGPDEAVALCEKLQPRWVIPMHYRSPRVDLNMAPRSDFVTAVSPIADVVQHTQSTLVCDATNPPNVMEVHLLEPSR